MNKNILIVASMGSMIAQFNMNNINILLSKGYKIHVACNLSEIDPMSEEKRKKLIRFFEKNNIVYYHIDFPRGIGSIYKNFEVYKQLKKIFKNNEYQFIHTHSPLASIFSRIFALFHSIPIIYTAHGFQFFKNGPKKDWLIFFPIEYIFSIFTDLVITINNEDYQLAKKMKFKKVEYVPGVGIDYKKIQESKLISRISRKDLGLSKEDVVLLSVGELSNRKNHEVVIQAIEKLPNNIKYLICGTGELNEYLQELVTKKNLDNRVTLLGYRTDVYDIMNISDIFVFPSKREGLGLAAIEAMASGLPLITSNINGINDYSQQGYTGYLCNPTDIDQFTEYIKVLSENENFRYDFSRNNVQLSKKYDLKNVDIKMSKIYSSFIGEHL